MQITRHTSARARVIAGLVAFSGLTAQSSATVFWSGALETTDQTFNRPANLFGLSFTGTNVFYDAQPFWVEATGDYIFESGQDFDGFICVYSVAFNPLDAMAGLIGGGDEFVPDPNSPNSYERNELLSPWNYSYGSKVDSVWNGFGSLSLIANAQYYAITTSFSNDDTGHYDGAIGGGLGAAHLGVVPEPATLATMGIALGILSLRRRTGRRSTAASKP